jgi:hypothetical protein
MVDLKRAWDQVTGFYAHRPTPAFQAEWKKAMENYDEEIIEELVEHITHRMDRFPALSQWISIADSIQFNLRQAQLQQEKVRERTEATEFWRGESARDETGRQALKAIRDLLSGAITRGQYLERCEGLGHNMQPMRDYYFTHKLPLAREASTTKRS